MMTKSSIEPTREKPASDRQPDKPKALKHGYYARQFRRGDVVDLEAIDARLEGEIAALRTTARRIYEQASRLEAAEADPMQVIQAFLAFGTQCRTIAMLARTRAQAGGGAERRSLAVLAALEVVGREWKTL